MINYKILLKIYNLIIINHVNNTCSSRFSHVKLYFLNRDANCGLTPLHYTHHGLTPLPPHHTTGSLHHTTTVAPRCNRGAVTLSPTLLPPPTQPFFPNHTIILLPLKKIQIISHSFCLQNSVEEPLNHFLLVPKNPARISILNCQNFVSATCSNECFFPSLALTSRIIISMLFSMSTGR